MQLNSVPAHHTLNFGLTLTQHRPKITWIGKIQILKTLALSKLNYIVSNLELPEWATIRTKAIFYDFLWNGMPPRVKNSVVTNKIEEGGLRMTNIDNYVLAQKAGWVKRLLMNKETVPYHFLNQFMPGISIEHFLKCSMNPEDIPLMIPLFYRQVLYAWFT